MSDSEKWACWVLGVVALTLVAYGIFFAFLGHHPAIGSVFSLLALTALPVASRRRLNRQPADERDREIGGRAVRTGFSVLWVAFIGVFLAIGFIKGWNAVLTVPVWMLAETIFWAYVLVLAVQAVTTLVLYRSGPHV